MLSAAAVAAASAVPVIAQEAAQSTSPNEKLSVAVIGVRGRGQSHLSAYAGRNDTEVTHICDADEAIGQARVEEVAARQGRRPQFVKDMRRVFEDQSVDLVTTATPNHWHALCAVWAIQAGKDVYVEKPVSHNVREGRSIVAAARKYNRICQTGTQSRSSGSLKAAIEYMRSGQLGEVRLARALCYKRRNSIGDAGTYAVPASVDYNLWLGPAPQAESHRRQFHYDWHWFWDYGNGDLGNQGIHQMDIARWGLGASGLGQSVLSYGGRVGYVDSGETANTQVCIHNYGDKSLVFEVRGLPTQPLRNVMVGNIFYGTNGIIVVNGGTAVLFSPEGEQVRTFAGTGEDHFANALRAIRSRRKEDLNADIEEGHLSSALCHLGNISYRLGEQKSIEEVRAALGRDAQAQETFGRMTEHLTANNVALANTQLRFGQPLTLTEGAETFQNHERANAMLTREYRAPFVVPNPDRV